MQGMTHIAMGALGAAVYHRLRSKETASWQAYGLLALVLPLLVISHVLLDDLAMATYHPADALLDDPFWLGFHGLVLLLTLYLLARYWRYGLFLAAALLPDIDWLARMIDLWPEGSAHAFVRSLPGIVQLSDSLRAVLPDWRLLPLAAFLEILLLFVLLFSGSWVARKQAQNSA